MSLLITYKHRVLLLMQTFNAIYGGGDVSGPPNFHFPHPDAPPPPSPIYISCRLYSVKIAPKAILTDM